VTYNSRQAAYQAALHLAERGCKSLLYFASTTLPYIEERRLGIAAAVSTLERFGVAVTNRINPATFTDAELAVARLVSGGSLSRAEEMHLIHNAEKIAYHWAVEVLKSGVVFDGVVAANDRQALGFMRAAAERGLQVGRDYAIIGFDNELVAEAYELSSMRPPFEAMGREAVRIAMAHVEGEEERQCSQLYSRLVERASSRLLRETENRERTAGSKG
jgi:DNA-binding LacI/PurR family transcriptional regulator